MIVKGRGFKFKFPISLKALERGNLGLWKEKEMHFFKRKQPSVENASFPTLESALLRGILTRFQFKQFENKDGLEKQADAWITSCDFGKDAWSFSL